METKRKEQEDVGRRSRRQGRDKIMIRQNWRETRRERLHLFIVIISLVE